MKILHITGTYKPSVNGVAVSVETLSKGLRERGHDVYILAPKNGLSKDPAYIFRYPSIPNPMVKDFPIPFFPITPDIINLLMSEKFDIVHAHHPFHISFFADIIARFQAIPMVFTYHTKYDEYAKIYGKFISAKLAKQITHYTVKNVVKQSDLVIAPSHPIAAFLKKFVHSKKVVVLPTPFDVEKRDLIRRLTFRKKLGLSLRSSVLLSVVRLTKEKNVDLLISAMAYLPDYTLIIVGEGPQKKEFKSLARKLKVSDRILFVGKVEHKKIGNFYNIANLFVFPSLSETQGVILLEALQFGLPIVAVDSPVNAEWVIPAVGRLSQNDPKSFANTIKKVSKLNKKEVKNAARKLLASFTVSALSKKLEEAYMAAIKTEVRSKPKVFDTVEDYLTKLFSAK